MAFTSLVKNLNERQVIGCMRDGCMYTKQELARRTGLSFPTVGKLVDELVERGMLLFTGVDESSQGGRKAGLYRLDGDFAHTLQLFLQGEKVFYTVSDATGERISGGVSAAEGRQYAAELLKSAIMRMRERDERIQAVSVGVPGGVSKGKVCYIDGYEALKGRELEKELSDCAGVPVCVSNNMNALAFGLAANGAGSMENLVCIHLADTGPGCGAVVNGRPVEGFCGFNGEVGFMPLFGERTLQDVAMSDFEGVSPGEFLGKLIVCVCTLLNPAGVILYIERDWKGVEEETLAWCRRFMPVEAVPQLTFAGSYQEDYLHGLTVIGTEMLFSHGTAV